LNERNSSNSRFLLLEDIFIISVGQCGNQIGHRFWQLAIDEFCNYKTKISNEMLSSFFRVTDSKFVEYS
jgi:tubulin epsilon